MSVILQFTNMLSSVTFLQWALRRSKTCYHTMNKFLDIINLFKLPSVHNLFMRLCISCCKSPKSARGGVEEWLQWFCWKKNKRSSSSLIPPVCKCRKLFCCCYTDAQKHKPCFLVPLNFYLPHYIKFLRRTWITTLLNHSSSKHKYYKCYARETH